MAITLAVLIVEDTESDVQLVTRALKKGGYEITYEQVETAAQMRAALEKQTWDIVISDYSLPQFNGPAALKLLQEMKLDIPFIVVSGTIGEETAVDVMKAGAHDYLMKGNLTRLVPAIERELSQVDIRRERKQAEEAVEFSNKRFRALIENSADAITLLDANGIVIYDSPAAPGMLGYGADELIGQNAFTLIHPEDLPKAQGLLQNLVKTPGARVNSTIRLRHKNGTWLWIEAVATNLLAEPSVKAIVTNYRDITERKRTEERIQRQLEQLTGLSLIDRAITASFELRITLDILLEQVMAQLHVDAAAVLLHVPHLHTLKFEVGRGFRTKAIESIQLRLGESYAGRAALERRLIHVANLKDTSGLSQTKNLNGEGFVSYYGVPLISKGQVKGVLEIFHRSRLHPDEQWLGFLQTLAGQAAIAIDNAQLFQELHRSNVELTRAYDATIEGWSRALDLRDKETEGHTQRVTEMTLRLAERMGRSDEELVHIRRGALLHDIGKLGVPDGILLKPGTLTDEEWVVMKMHPQYAYDMLAPIDYLRRALDIPYCHHEKWDGTGYPRKLKGEEIPLAARIFAIVDVWDALRSDRPYRAGWSSEKVRDYIRQQSGTHFDPQVVEVFLKLGV